MAVSSGADVIEVADRFLDLTEVVEVAFLESSLKAIKLVAAVDAVILRGAVSISMSSDTEAADAADLMEGSEMATEVVDSWSEVVDVAFAPSTECGSSIISSSSASSNWTRCSPYLVLRDSYGRMA